jgi:hypothetical protein
MTSNQPFPQVASYPAGFLSAVQNGGGVFYAAHLPWTPHTAAKRFRQLLALLRQSPGHPAHANAAHRWRVEATPRALVTSMQQRGVPAAYPHALLIEAALEKEQS